MEQGADSQDMVRTRAHFSRTVHAAVFVIGQGTETTRGNVYRNVVYSGRKITASFVDRYKLTRGREGKTARR
jgi:hypothetical protein